MSSPPHNGVSPVMNAPPCDLAVSGGSVGPTLFVAALAVVAGGVLLVSPWVRPRGSTLIVVVVAAGIVMSPVAATIAAASSTESPSSGVEAPCPASTTASTSTTSTTMVGGGDTTQPDPPTTAPPTTAPVGYAAVIGGTEWQATTREAAERAMGRYTEQLFASGDAAGELAAASRALAGAVEEVIVPFAAGGLGEYAPGELEQLAAAVDEELVAAYEAADGSMAEFAERGHQIRHQLLARLEDDVGLSADDAGTVADALELTERGFRARFELAHREDARLKLDLLSGAIGELPGDVESTVTTLVADGEFVAALDAVHAYYDPPPSPPTTVASTPMATTATEPPETPSSTTAAPPTTTTAPAQTTTTTTAPATTSTAPATTSTAPTTTATTEPATTEPATTTTTTTTAPTTTTPTTTTTTATTTTTTATTTSTPESTEPEMTTTTFLGPDEPAG